MKKVAHIVSTLQPGGAEVLLLDICRNIGKDYALSVIYGKSGSLYDKFLETNTFLKHIQKDRFYLSYFFKLRKYLKDENFDIIHLHSVVNPFPFLFVIFFTDVKTVFTIHGYSLNRRKISKWLTFLFFDSILFVSETLKKTYLGNQTKESQKFSVLYNGIDTTKFDREPNSIRKKISISDKKFRMGFVGNFNTVRDHLTVCKALKFVKEKEVDFSFLFVGAAHISELYEECYSYCDQHGLLEHVYFLGSRNDVPEILSSLDLFVYASHQDTFGIAVVEAMMSGTPVVVNDLDVFKEITDGGRYARLYKTRDEVDLAESIEELIDNPSERKKLGSKGKDWAEKNFSIQVHINQLNNIYLNLLERDMIKKTRE